MGRLPQAEATKGSQKWIQVLVNQKTDLLNSLIKTNIGLSISEEITWRSPLAIDNYIEYKDEDFLRALEIQSLKAKLAEFWPTSGPRWDALAKSSTGKLFLVEAKSHITELISDFKGSNPESIKKINNSLNETKKRFGVAESYNWTKNFYQYANRIAHINFLTQNKCEAWLVNVYFLNDADMDGPRTLDEWRGAIRLMHRCLGLREHLLSKNVIDVFVDITFLNRGDF
jgi:hypothetical protein